MKIVGFCYTFNQQKRKQKENKFYLFCAERVGIARAWQQIHLFCLAMNQLVHLIQNDKSDPQAVKENQ